MKRLLFITALALVALFSAQTVSTIAGSGAVGSTDGTGTTASFKYPVGIALDASGNFYVADSNNHKIRKINATTGEVTTFAGSGAYGSAEGAAATASFRYPWGVEVDASGNVYVADDSNHKIRKIDATTGEVTTLAGSGAPGNTEGTGSAASFYYPEDVAIDAAGNVYVADLNNHKIRKITPEGVVSTLAGGGGAGSTDSTGPGASFTYPSGIAIDASGFLYVAEFGHKIRKINSTTGEVTTLAGSGVQGSADGTGAAASFDFPSGIAVDASGNVYVGDQSNHKIRKITPAGEVTTLAGSGANGSTDGSGSTASFAYPYGVVIDASGNVYVADQDNNKIRKITPAVALSTQEVVKNPLRIYPNPASSSFGISGLSQRSALQIMDLSGKVVLSTEVSNGETINTESLTNGLYLVKVAGQTSKLIIKK